MTRIFLLVVMVLAALNPVRLEGADRPQFTIEVPGMIVEGGGRVAIHAFPPVGFDFNRPPGYWPYGYPPYPAPHPAFPAYPIHPSYGAPMPYVPFGGSYAAPPLEIRAMELKPGGRIVIEVEPEDAVVFVDAMRLTTRNEYGYEIGLLAGRHRIDVRRRDMRPWSQDVEVPPGGGLLLSVKLEPEQAAAEETR